MKTKHTPGPYPLTATLDGQRFVIVTNQGNHYATTYDPQAAKMIQYGPELLATLRALIKRCASLDQSVTHDGIENCYAIAKAGEAIGLATGAIMQYSVTGEA
jgi:hypothetical protein